MYLITEEDINSHKKKYDLEVHYNAMQTAPGTRKFNDSRLLRNPTIYQLGKYITCYYHEI